MSETDLRQIRSMSTFARWRYALKPDSWSKLFVPMTIGQALGIAHLGRVDIWMVGVGWLGTFLTLAAVVLLNDWGDRRVDTIKRQLFPGGCSPKTIPDRILPAEYVLMGGLVAASLTVWGAFHYEGWLGRPGLGWATLLALGLFFAYSLPPIRLNYRGGGELLEMAGVGLALPWINAYLQGGLGALGLWFPRAGHVLWGAMLFALASAVASGLSDEISDRKGGKRTFTTMLGNGAARRLSETLVLLGLGAWWLAAFASEHIPFLAVGAATATTLWYYLPMRAISGHATTNAFAAQKSYKQLLHNALWQGQRVLAGGLVIDRLFL